MSLEDEALGLITKVLDKLKMLETVVLVCEAVKPYVFLSRACGPPFELLHAQAQTCSKPLFFLHAEIELRFELR